VGVEVFPVSLGFNDCYVIRASGDNRAVMVDGGTAGRIDDFRKAIARIPIQGLSWRYLPHLPIFLSLCDCSRGFYLLRECFFLVF
jgi:hypothetical protein